MFLRLRYGLLYVNATLTIACLVYGVGSKQRNDYRNLPIDRLRNQSLITRATFYHDAS